MDREHEMQSASEGKYSSTKKTLRTVSLALLFHTYWPKRLSRDELIKHLSPLYGTTPIPTLYRDIATLTGTLVESLPRPDDPGLDEWCLAQQQLKRFAITYDRGAITFGLAQSFFTIDIDEDEARAFVALQEGFTQGTPYSDAVRRLLKRWEWLFNEKSHQLIQRKRQRRARPIVLPLSPVVDYSKHEAVILLLGKALEEGTYVSFAYMPLTQSRDAEPMRYQHIEPYELEYRDGHWYFTAYVLDLNTFLDYRVDRIQPESMQTAHDRFTPGLRKGPGVKIRYWVSHQLARHGSMSARLRNQHVTLLENDQGAIVEGYARSSWWARRLLLGYGELVKALEPDELVEMMRKTVNAMSEVYGEEE